MINVIRKVFSLLSRREKRDFFAVMLLVAVMSLTQLVGIGLLIPFMSVLMNQNLIEQQTSLSELYQFLGSTSSESFLQTLGLGILLFLLASSALNAFSVWLINTFCWTKQYRLSAQMLSRYMHQDYSNFLGHNSSEYTRNILFETFVFSSTILLPLVQGCASLLVASFILGFLTILNPAVTAIALLVFTLAYGCIYFLIRNPIKRAGELRLEADQERLKMVSEAFGSVKEVKILGAEDSFLARYKPPAKTIVKAAVLHKTLFQLPKYIVEGLAFSFVILGLLISLREGAVTEVIPLASAFALAGYRLLPTLQIIYRSISSLRANEPALDNLYRNKLATRNDILSPSQALDLPAVNFQKELVLDKVCYQYPGSNENVLKTVSMVIPKGAFIALVGHTGAGKSTLSDIILGLLEPSSGSLIIDGRPLLPSQKLNWQRSFGFVPQEIFLLDESIEANIAFGVPKNKIDKDSVEKAARIAELHEYISTLPNGYQTIAGERGVRFSGGQRQRIGLARALYHDPEILLLDEATSALDQKTESIVHSAIMNAAKTKTIIVIAHRLATVERCDQIFFFENGRLLDQGTYQELLQSCPSFHAMANTSNDD